MEQETNAIDLTAPSGYCCSGTAPRPCGEISAKIIHVVRTTVEC